MDPGVPAHDALRLMVDTYELGRKPMARRPPGRPHNVWLNKVQEDANALLCYLRCEDLRSPGGMERRMRATAGSLPWVHLDYAITQRRQR